MKLSDADGKRRFCVRCDGEASNAWTRQQHLESQQKQELATGSVAKPAGSLLEQLKNFTAPATRLIQFISQ